MLTPCVGKALGGFQDQVARRLTGRLPQRTPDGKWTYTFAVMAREEAEFLTMEEYIRRHQNTVAEYITNILGVGKVTGGACRDAMVRTGGT